MYFGAHVSVAGGILNGPLNAEKTGCQVFQFFSRSPQGGPAPAITEETAVEFRRSCKNLKMKQWVIHTPYYINFASNLARTRGNSLRIVREELERGTLLGTSYVMFHPGSAKDVGKKEGVQYVINGLKKMYEKYDGTTELLIEISAGTGMVIGDSFEEIAMILDGVGQPKLGVCFDTAHAFASGYDLRTKEAVHETFKQFDRIIGLDRLRMSHCNDSKVDLGERKDRHEHLGKGFIGIEGFRAIVHHPKLQHINLYLETEPDGREDDLKILRSF